MYLNSRTESDDGASAVLSDYCGYESVENEPHYITTHEIQPTELDDDLDCDQGRGTCWDFEDNNLVFSFVDYASFESDETQEGTLILEGMNQTELQPRRGGAGSTEQEDSDLCDSEKCASEDESEDKNRFANVGEIHLSIKASSRATNDSVSIAHEYTKDFGDGSRCALVSSGAIAEPFRDRAEYFIPAPGRQHLATKLRRKDINEYSSGASSSISELDDADKEVRNLTAKSFRSLACPYFDAINLSTSSESSLSEYGLNQWSSYMDWNYGNISRAEERRVIAHKTSSEALRMKNTVGGKRYGVRSTQNKMYAIHKATISQQSSSSEMNDTTQRGVTLNVRCNVNEPEVTRRTVCSKKGTVSARSGCAIQYNHTDGAGGIHKRAVYASSLLKNVISKKMQLEQERKLERGEICETYPALNPRFQLKDHDGVKDKGQERSCHRQTSESGSGFNSTDDQQSRCSSCESTKESGGNKVPEDFKKSKLLSNTQNNALSSANEDKPEPVGEVEAVRDTQTAKEGLETISIQSKLLFVPSCQLLSKKCFPKDLSGSATDPATDAPAASHQSGHIFRRGEPEKRGKSPEIKICLRSVKENKGCALNIASLLTPKISDNSTFRSPAEADAKCHILSSLDKMPHFTVRDIRDTKCKFHTPIYQVRDVRKLVKSSYQFVSLDKGVSKCTSAADKPEEKEAVKHAPPAPIVIKCQSVNTNVKPQTAEVSQKQAGSVCHPAQGENPSLRCTASRSPYAVCKPPEVQTNAEGKLIKHSLEKFELKEPKQAALEKLKAAVKTMEQLYIFDRNEWKRKTHTPQPAADGQASASTAAEERGAEQVGQTKADGTPRSNTEASKPTGDKGALDVKPASNTRVSETQSQEGQRFSNRSSLHFGKKASAGSSSAPQSSALQTSLPAASNTPAAPLRVEIESQGEQRKIKISPIHPSVAPASSDSENYLTIPGLGGAGRVRLLNPEPIPQEGNSDVHRFKAAEQKKSPVLLEYPAVPSVLHPSGPAAALHAQQHLLCLSPAVPPTPPAGDAQTQRKMLLDPTTGHYYLVDTPFQPATRRLFDPETGQYVDVPVPRPAAAHVAPISPVSLSVSPLTLGPAAYAPTYMIYPGFIPSPTLPAQTVFPQQQYHPEKPEGEVTSKSPRPEVTATGSESAYYSATSEAPQGPQAQPVGLGHVTTRGGVLSSDRKPVISITTQQGPRIIAPPSFDGTTMSFVVEHR
ncbi:unnamed protein product [Tetraodon nigroviridis]|uniref:(spotted green pufferfish) hypothetical protein n=1 Tax=Tetraodon nigroviridis TaxID=99883 RepID=Q4S6J4_TETNG|nr:unnamed protein product [Tetraodon nigroviridis]